MLCADCHENAATVHFTQIVDDDTETFHLCQECAKLRGLKSPPASSDAPLADFLSQMGAPIFTSASNANEACPRCGCTFRQFRRTGRLGCAMCYDTFDREMAALLTKIHGSDEHVGIRNEEGLDVGDGPVARLLHLRRELRQAVHNEEYERAAELRDSIQRLEEDEAVTIDGGAVASDGGGEGA